MKIVLMIFAIAWLSVSQAMPQATVTINGTVTEINSGLPVPDHPVTILSDSSYGFFYYQVVYTDSLGFYHDDVPLMSDSITTFFVQTFDCQDYLHQQVVVINPVQNVYTRDFQICILVTDCQAYFSYYPDPQGSPDSFQFTDQSTGDIVYWSWSFGDSTYSNEQNPYHQFPGPGTYQVCLTAGNNACSDDYCSVITISDTVYHQIYGQVFAGNFPLQQGIVDLFALSPSGGYYQYGEGFNVDSNGIYYFTLVPDGIYLVLAVPFDSTGFIPTYYGDVIHWQEATRLILGEPENPYNINLVQIPVNSLVTGPCSISGHIEGGDAGPDFIRNFHMLLMNTEGTAIAFCKVSSSGNYIFPSIDFGTYFIKAELAGVSSYNMQVDLTQDQPEQVVNLNYSNNSIMGIKDDHLIEYQIDIFPNPVNENLNIHCELPVSGQIAIGIYSLTGQKVYEYTMQTGTAYYLSVSVKNFPAGIYSVRICSPGGISVVRKIVKL